MLTAATVASVVAGFDLGELIDCAGPVARGEVGEVFRLRTTTASWAVKRPFGPLAEADVERSTTFSEAARSRGVRTPAARRTAGGRVLLETSDGPLRVHAWVDLDGGEDSRLDPAAVGRLVAQLHRVPDDGGGTVDDWYSAPVGSDRWAELAGLLTAAGAPFAGDLEALLPVLAALEAVLTPPARSRTCHRDLFADNLRRGTDGRLWVLDFDGAGPADPAQELAMVLYDIGGGDPGREQALSDAYRGAGGPAVVRTRGDLTTAIASLGHIGERACVRWLAAAPGDPERDRMASLFGEFAERPLTVDTIDATLAALR